MALLSDYAAGTVDLTTATKTVTGTGTAWQTAQFQEGDWFIAGGYVGIIASVDSETQITLVDNWAGATLSGAPYRLRYMSDGSRASAQARALINLINGGGTSLVSAQLYDITGTGDETSKFTTALSNVDFMFLPPGDYTTTGLTQEQIAKIWGFGTLTNSGSAEIVKFTLPQGLYVAQGTRDGTGDDIINLPTAGVALEVHNRKNSTNNAVDIYNKGNFAAGNSAASSLVMHHYTDGVGMQLDNVGTNWAAILKAARNDIKRPDKGENWVATGGFLAMTRAGSGIVDATDEVGATILSFPRSGDLYFEDDPAITTYRRVAARGSQRLKVESEGGLLWLQPGPFNAADSVINHVLMGGPVRLNQVNSGTGYTAAQVAYMLFREGDYPKWSTAAAIKSFLFLEDAVGTVSQSSGVPTGAIIETGANANGRYTRFADGTQICMSPDLALDIVTLVTAPIYRGFAGWTLPAAFVDTNYIVMSNVGTSPTAWGGNGVVSTVSACTLRAEATSSQSGLTVEGIAIGRWF